MYVIFIRTRIMYVVEGKKKTENIYFQNCALNENSKKTPYNMIKSLILINL